MSRSNRLFSLLDALRHRRYPVTATVLAEELSVSVRTIYRDIQTLTTLGAHIEGAAGFGYLLRPGFLLPPLMFAEAEIEALVLGMRWVAQQQDADLARAARQALAKIEAVLPAGPRAQMEGAGLIVPKPDPAAFGSVLAGSISFPAIRLALREERKLDLRYRDQNDRHSRRIVWPIALAFFSECPHSGRLVRNAPRIPAFPPRPDAGPHHRAARSPPIRRRTLMARWRRSLTSSANS